MDNSTYVLGVDVSKDSLTLCLIERNLRTVLLKTDVQNTHQAIETAIRQLPVDDLTCLCVAIEPTNTYWFDFAQTALSAGCKVVSAPPGPAKLFLRSRNPRVKNDKLDAQGIALYAASMDLKAYQPKPETITALQELLALRRKVSETIAYYAQLANTNAASADVASNLLDYSRQQLSDLDRRIKDSTKALEPAQRLIKVPGFGTVVTAALSSKLLTIDFKSSDAFVAYVGLDLKVRESGKHKGRRMLSRNGDAELRRLLYLAAQASIRVKGSPFAQIYQTHKAPNRQLTSTEAICVVARKLARTAWSIVRYRTEYNPARVLAGART